MISGHGGNIYDMAKKLDCKSSDITDMSSNLNPFGPPEGLFTKIKENLEGIITLPEVDSRGIIDLFAENHGLEPGQVLAGNGTTQFIYSIPQALGTKKALILGPTYADYADACSMNNIEYSTLVSDESQSFVFDMEHINNSVKGFDTVFICNPNNPTGVLIPSEDLETLCSSNPHIFFIIDESYLPFVIGDKNESMSNMGLSNVVVLNSMSKIFRVPGLRIGFLVSNIEVVKKFRRYLLPWSVNLVAQEAISFLMNEKEKIRLFVEKTVKYLEIERECFSAKFDGVRDIKLFPSRTSFILAKLYGTHTSKSVCENLARSKKILLRDCFNFNGLSEHFIRISLKTREENNNLAEALMELFK
jgi:threonine-phosphate decarboxylase